MRRAQKEIKAIIGACISILTLSTANIASTRTVEMRFALSADARSEFSTRFPLLSAGRILIEADWSSATNKHSPVSLSLVLIQPDGVIAARQSGGSVLRLEHRAGEQVMASFANGAEAKWTVKILNETAARSEVSGILRVTVPAASHALEDTQFTLLGSGNAQEIPFTVPAPGRIEIEVSWDRDVLAGAEPPRVALVISLIHPGEVKTYARREGASPIRVEQQISEQALDRGVRWVVRVQNDSQIKVRGRLKVTYTPSL